MRLVMGRAVWLACSIAIGGCAGTPHTIVALAANEHATTNDATVADPIVAPPAPPPAPLSAPARRVLEAAQRMYEEDIIVRGSCYRYIDTVYTEAGYDGWRRQSTVFRGSRNGPYADLELIQPGDWLYIVNHPEATPVGTHSVLFVEWQDRAQGIAQVYSYVGGGRERSADLVPYDVSRTYSIRRAVDPEPAE